MMPAKAFQKLIPRNIVTLVFVPSMCLMVYGWYRLQLNNNIIPEEFQKDDIRIGPFIKISKEAATKSQNSS
jgi:hypothetical protein